MPDYFTNHRIHEALDGRPIAGGNGYHADISLDDADVIVTDQDALASALTSSADVIGIEGHTRIDLSGRDYELADQTIVSDRGIDGSPGALLYTTDQGAESLNLDAPLAGKPLVDEERRRGLRIALRPLESQNDQ